MGRRARVLSNLRNRRDARIVVASARAVVQRLAPGTTEIEPTIVGVGDQLDPHELVARLVEWGYRRDVQVEHRGDVALRGSIVDVFPSTGDAPVRIDLWGDEIDRMTEFSIADQRSTVERSEVAIFPAREFVPDDLCRQRAADLVGSAPWGRQQWQRLADGELFDGMESWLPWLADGTDSVVDLLDADAHIVLVDPARLRSRASDLLGEEHDLAASLARTWDVDDVENVPRLHLELEHLLARGDAPVSTITTLASGPGVPSLAASAPAAASAEGGGPVHQIVQLLSEGYRVVITADGSGSAVRLADRLGDEGVDLPIVDELVDRAGGQLIVAGLDHGLVLPESRLAIISESDLTGRRRTHRRRRARQVDAQRFFDDLAPGDHVVHQTHGVARYGGMVTRSIGGSERDYLLLEYRGTDRLYLPSDQIDTVRHYTGGDSPSLSRMGGADWQKTKGRVRAAVDEIAQELVVLYQKRHATTGHAFAADTPWQSEIESAFPFQETPDQLVAIDAVKADMERGEPMDRLVCGDVGFGKTEIAVRAAFKAVQDGKQVAVLVPTTLLAQQHLQTFSERFASYPIRVEVLSRFLSTKQAKEVVAGIESGEVDVVIGTHRLLSQDVTFRNLGLLVVDEEQRFGVSHKEAIKQLRADLDVLTLTATPIPRTLEMSLTGIRDLTVLSTPPADRQPILTYVGEYDERAVSESIRRELLRDGQVFFVHNRVMDIEHVAADLKRLVPEARVAVAHGQMDEARLESVVLDFWEGKYDVLVCTTIIESGIDMPTVNTLVVDRADLMGLGQLHQLRGRVGRSGSRAYAYLFTPPDHVLTEEAYERLKTIGETTELGSGFKIAMRDLEIRGAGNLLGTGQSGHIAAVGYDLYCQMVTEAVAELKGETPDVVRDVKLDLPIDAHLPAEYVPKEVLRLEAYRRLAAVTTNAEVDDIAAEWADRYGPVPPAGESLLAIARLRVACFDRGIEEIAVSKGPGFGGPKWMAKVSPVELRASKKMRLERLYKGSTFREQVKVLQLALPSATGAAVDLVAAFDELMPAAAVAP
jgi:transcription-repair coupling factor (superfamily II helicase)